MKWTTEQKNVFNQPDTLLVSASAGSGKTTVMVKCIADVLTKSVPIESVVVMSYTVASAADMRQKIIDRLYRYAREGVDDECNAVDVEHVKKQIDNLPFAEISTVDGFCACEIRKNFQVLGLDPTFRQLDEEEADLLKNAVISDLLDELRASADERIGRLFMRMDAAGDMQTGGLKPMIIKLYDAISLHVNPAEFVKEIRGSSRAGAMHARYEGIITKYYAATAADLHKIFQTIGGFPDERWQLWYNAIDEFAASLACASGFEDLRRALAYMPNTDVPRHRAEIDGTEKAVAKGVRDALKSLTAELREVLSRDDDRGAEEPIDVVLDIVDEFASRYARKKADTVALDFNDLSRYAVKLLSDDARAAEIRSRISHVFVDEYQDVNALQEYILQRIAPEDKLFMVGDSKQSIYAFRNADTQIFLDKAAAFERGDRRGVNRRLTQNFRSSKRILEFNDRLFSEVMVKWLSGIDYKTESKFINENTDMTADNLKDEGAEVEIKFYTVTGGATETVKGVYSVEHARTGGERLTKEYIEGREAAERISKIVGHAVINEGGKLRKIRYGDVAILLRSRSASARQFIRGLRDGGVPYVTDGFEGSTGEAVRKTLVNLLRVIDNSQNEIPFAGYMLSYFGGFTENELLEIKGAHEELPIYGAVRAECDGGQYAERCKTALLQIEKWRARASYNDAGSLLTYIVTESGYDAYVLSKPSGRTEFAALNAFLTSLTGHAAAGEISGFLRYYDGTKRAFTDAPSVEFSDSVQVMTVHGSKGLEFPVVFVCMTNERSGGKGASPDLIVDRDLGVGVKIFDDASRAKRNSLAYTAITLNSKLKAAAENVRLLYVAMTRAKNYLYVSGTVSARAAADGLRLYKPLTELSCFSDYLLYAAMRDARLRLLIGDAEKVERSGVEGQEALPPVVFNTPDEVYAREFDKVLNYKYSHAAATKISPKYTVTELNRMEEDVCAFVPSLYVTDGRARGIAYHTVMENIDFKLLTLTEVETAIAAMVKSGVLMQEDAALVSAEEILKCITHPIIQEGIKGRYFREQSFMLNLPANKVLDTDATDNVLIQGTIDLLLFGKENAVIDFKSSGAVSEILLERYKKQLNVYVTAVETVFRVKIDKRYLYSFREGRFLEL